MKKQLLFVAAMFAAVCANAQGTWNCVPEGAAVDEVFVPACTEGVAKVMETPIKNATVALMDGAKDWTVKGDAATSGTFVAANGLTYSERYVQGGTNGMAGNLQHANGVSAHIQFTPAVAGKVWIAAKYGKSKPIWAAKVPANVIDNEELDFADMTAYATSVWGKYITADGGLADAQSIPDTDPDKYAALPYDVEPGFTYFFWVSGSKIMLCGITFETSGSNGINNITTDVENANAPVYNLAGQRVSKNAKGILIQNGKKFIK